MRDCRPSVHAIVGQMLRRRNLRSALTVSILVGLILNVVNNGEQYLAHRTMDWSHVIMNFVVPFFVSSYSAARAQARHFSRS